MPSAQVDSKEFRDQDRKWISYWVEEDCLLSLPYPFSQQQKQPVCMKE